MTCPHCHRNVGESETTCSVCGFPLGIKCPACETKNEISAKNCVLCGKTLPKYDDKKYRSINEKYEKSVFYADKLKIPAIIFAVLSFTAINFCFNGAWWYLCFISLGLSAIGIMLGWLSKKSPWGKAALIVAFATFCMSLVVMIIFLSLRGVN